MSENKLVQSWGLGDFRIVEWENYSQNGAKYSSYSLTKTEYEKPKNHGEKGTYKTAFGISLFRKEDLIIIKNLLKRRSKEGTSFGEYYLFPKSSEPKNNTFRLSKVFEDKTGEKKNQSGELNIYEMFLLEELIDYAIKNVLVSNFKPKSKNTNSYEDNGAYFGGEQNKSSDNSFIETVNDDIPF
jgi:hypothetical protein